MKMRICIGGMCVCTHILTRVGECADTHVYCLPAHQDARPYPLARSHARVHTHMAHAYFMFVHEQAHGHALAHARAHPLCFGRSLSCTRAGLRRLARLMREHVCMRHVRVSMRMCEHALPRRASTRVRMSTCMYVYADANTHRPTCIRIYAYVYRHIRL